MSSKLLDSQNESIVFKAASDLLDRDERSSKRRKMTVHNLHEILTPQMLAAAAACAKEIKEFEESRRFGGEQARLEEGTVLDTSLVETSDDTDW